MANENLENLVKIGKLKVEDPDAKEIAGLIRSGTARLDDAKNETLSIESRFEPGIQLCTQFFVGCTPDVWLPS